MIEHPLSGFKTPSFDHMTQHWSIQIQTMDEQPDLVQMHW
jgi:hypothetical protein